MIYQPGKSWLWICLGLKCGHLAFGEDAPDPKAVEFVKAKARALGESARKFSDIAA